MTPNDLIATAQKLLDGNPSNTDVRRAVSTAYYSLFHHVSRHLSQAVAAPFVTTSPTGGWLKLYRSPDHAQFLSRCNEAQDPTWTFPAVFTMYADTFVKAYKSRIEADYDPSAIVSLNDAIALIKTIELAFSAFDASPREQQRAFVLFLCLRPKSR